MIHTARAAPLRVAAWVKVWGLGGTLGLKPNLNLVQLRGSHSFKAWLRRLPCQTARWVHPEHEWPLAKATEGRRILQRDRRRFASMA